MEGIKEKSGREREGPSPSRALGFCIPHRRRRERKRARERETHDGKRSGELVTQSGQWNMQHPGPHEYQVY